MSTVILALIPNGLVLSIALTYALGAVRLLGKDVLVQQFNAVESLSNVDVLCTDKTGTLTSGVVTFEELAGLGADDARAARLLGAFAASTTDANRTIEALRTALPGGAPDGRARGLLLVRSQVERPRLRRRRGARHLRARRARDARAGAGRRRATGARGRRVGRARPARRPVRRARRAGRLRRRPRRPARPARRSRGARPHLLQRRAAAGRARHARGVLRGRHRRQDHLGRQPQDGGRPRHAGRRALAAAPRGRGLVLRHGERGRPDAAADRRAARPNAGDGDSPAPGPAVATASGDDDTAGPSAPPSERSSWPSPGPSSRSSRPRTSPPRPTRPASSAASRPSRSRTSSRPCATAGATSR